MNYILWDCECQCELMRANSEAEIELHIDLLPGGSYHVYECPTGFKIVNVEGRTPERKTLKITLESFA